METPRAALDAAAIARAVDFFAWGSNDLTQFTLGIARSVFPIVAPNIGSAEPDPSESLDLGAMASCLIAPWPAGRPPSGRGPARPRASCCPTATIGAAACSRATAGGWEAGCRGSTRPPS